MVMELEGGGRVKPSRARLEEPMKLLAAVARVRGVGGDIIGATCGGSEHGLAAKEDRKSALTVGCGGGAGGRAGGAGDAAVAGPMTTLSAVVANTLEGVDMEPERGVGWAEI